MNDKLYGIWHKENEVTLEQLFTEGFDTLFIRTYWDINTDTMDSYLARLNDIYIKAKDIGFTYFIMDYGQGMGKLNNNNNYKIVADYFKNAKDMCFYIGEPYEEYIEKQKLEENDVLNALEEKIEYVDGNVMIDSTKRNSFWLKLWFKNSVRFLAVSSYWKQQTEWDNTNSVWITGQLGYHNISSWRYKSLAEKSKDKKLFMMYQFNPTNFSSDGFENALYETFFNFIYVIKKFIFRMKEVKTGKQKRIELEANKRKEFISVFKVNRNDGGSIVITK